jgi:hypothetical protein
VAAIFGDRMLRAILVTAVSVSCMVPSVAAAANTPDGPATLLGRFVGASTLEGRAPEVLVAVRVVVGEGGRAGTIRIRANYGANTLVGDPVQLPAEPGTYTFPAPHIRWDYRGGQLAIDQTTGGHAIVVERACAPELGRHADPCQIYSLDVFGGDPPPGTAGTPTEQRPGASLALTGIFEGDSDQDLRGDKTEDRTDLQVSAVPGRDPDGRLRVAVTVHNAGPLTADLPVLNSSPLPAGRWESGCLQDRAPWYTMSTGCRLAPLAAGESRTLEYVSDVVTAGDAAVSVSSEGTDLTAADNTARFAITRPSMFGLGVPTSARPRDGITVNVRSVRTARARITVAFKKRGRTVKFARVVALKAFTARTVRVRPGGAALRSLRRASPVQATVTVRTLAGDDPLTLNTTFRNR